MTRILLPVLILALAAAGCGGGGGGGQLSAAEYRQQADEICADTNKDLQAIPRPQSPAQISDYVGKARPVIEEGLSDLEKLDAPDELQDAADRWNEQNRLALDQLEGLRVAKPTELQQKAAEFDRINNEANRIARNELGLKTCAED